MTPKSRVFHIYLNTFGSLNPRQHIIPSLSLKTVRKELLILTMASFRTRIPLRLSPPSVSEKYCFVISQSYYSFWFSIENIHMRCYNQSTYLNWRSEIFSGNNWSSRIDRLKMVIYPYLETVLDILRISNTVSIRTDIRVRNHTSVLFYYILNKLCIFPKKVQWGFGDQIN